MVWKWIIIANTFSIFIVLIRVIIGQCFKALAATSIALLPHQSSLKRKLLIANAAGAVTLHQLTSSWTQSDDNELHNFKSWLNLLIADRI